MAELVRDGSKVIGTSTAHFEDVQGKLTFDEIRSPTLAAQFRTIKDAQPNFGYSTSAHWLRFTVDGSAGPARLLRKSSKRPARGAAPCATRYR